MSHATEKLLVTWRISQCGKLHYYLVFKNCHCHPHLQQPLAQLVSCHQHQNKSLHLWARCLDSWEKWPGEGHGNLLQYCAWRIPMRNRVGWSPQGCKESDTIDWLSNSNNQQKVYDSLKASVQFSSVAQSCPTLRPHESQHAGPPCPSPTPRVYPNPCPSSQWCHPAISASVVPFSSCPQSLPTSGSYPMSQLLAWGGQSIGVSASASVLPMNTQDWSLGWTTWWLVLFSSKVLWRVHSLFRHNGITHLISYSRMWI